MDEKEFQIEMQKLKNKQKQIIGVCWVIGIAVFFAGTTVYDYLLKYLIH